MMPGGYYNVGKQVLWGNKDVAQACDNATANLIAEALNAHPEAIPDHVPVIPELAGCRAYQASDQMLCPCGLAWDVNDPDPPECNRAGI